MKRFRGIIISLAIWGAVVFYIVWSSELGRMKRSETLVSEVNITVADSLVNDLVCRPVVSAWIDEAGLNPLGKRVGEVDREALRGCIMQHGYAREAGAWVDLDGKVNITVIQRYPVARVVMGGYDFYITDDRHILPSEGYPTQYITLVTGDFGLPFDTDFNGNADYFAELNEKKYDKNYIFLSKLINFVNYIRRDDFWRSQIVQINVSGPETKGPGGALGIYKEPEIEIIPRLGEHVIEIGTLDGYMEKLHNLMLFYRLAVPAEGWGRWSRISLKYDDLIVCS